MIHAKFIAKIQDYIKPYYPGYLAVIDIAAFKIRNDLLGHLEGDRDILDLETIIIQNIDNPNFKARIGGEEWLLFFPNHPVKQLQAIADDFAAKKIKVTVGWRCQAQNQISQLKDIKETKKSVLYRGIKICYTAIDNPSELVNKSEMLKYNTDYSHTAFPVNKPVETLQKILQPYQQIWQSIELTLPQFYCPFCQHTKFNWEDGGGMFNAEGNCQKCHAEVAFSGICNSET
ncbi:MAG: GGDEF domain-containing protein [Cyanobacteria bacterium P01_G01_bin.19]